MLTYKEALSRHGVVQDAEALFAKKQVKEFSQDVWNALTDKDAAPAAYSFAEAIVMTMPVQAIPVVRNSTGVTAAFVLNAAAEVVVPGRDYMAQAKMVWQKYNERAKLANNVQEGYGCDKSASWELAREVAGYPDARKVEEIAKMAGRMYKVLHGVRKVPTNDPHEVVGVQVGGDVERLTAEELTALGTPGLSDMAAIKVLEKRAQQYRMKGKTTTSRGPLVIALDESGSMHDDGYANRNSWAKAAALALARVAHDSGRMVKIVHFAHVTAVTPCDPGNAQQLLDMTRHFFGGGTNIALALATSAREVGNLALQGFVGADVIVVSDGEDGDHKAQHKIINLMQAQGVRLWTVLIECELNEKAPLRLYSEEVLRVGGTDRADILAALRGAADNIVTDEEKQAAEDRKRAAAMN